VKNGKQTRMENGAGEGRDLELHLEAKKGWETLQPRERESRASEKRETGRGDSVKIQLKKRRDWGRHMLPTKKGKGSSSGCIIGTLTGNVRTKKSLKAVSRECEEEGNGGEPEGSSQFSQGPKSADEHRRKEENLGGCRMKERLRWVYERICEPSSLVVRPKGLRARGRQKTSALMIETGKTGGCGREYQPTYH